MWLASIHPMQTNFQSMNVQLPVAAALFFAEYLTRTTPAFKKQLGGFLVAIVSVVKVFPTFIAVFYFLKKENAVRKGLLAGYLFSFLSPFIFFGFSAGNVLYKDFFINLTRYSSKNASLLDGGIQSIPSILSYWVGSIVTPPILKLLMLICAALLCIPFFFWILRTRFEEKNISLHAWAVALSIMLLVNPSTRHDYFLMHVPLFASMMALKTEKQFSWLTNLLLLIGFVLAYGTTQAIVGRDGAELVNAWRLLAVGILCVLGAFCSVGLLRSPKSQIATR